MLASEGRIGWRKLGVAMFAVEEDADGCCFLGNKGQCTEVRLLLVWKERKGGPGPYSRCSRR
jgi:hypothetical protein